MTICISVRIPEGLVLAADSVVSLEGTINGPMGQQTGILQTFDYANKVTRIKDYPIGAMFWGAASISDRSILSLIMEFEYNYPLLVDNPDYTVRQVADALLEFIKEKYEAEFPAGGDQPRLGLFIGGYSSNEFFSSQYSYTFPVSTDWGEVRPDLADGRPNFGANWFGQTGALTRLINGYDKLSLEELVNRGVDRAVIQQWISDHVAELQLVFAGMPLQDAIDFANYAAQVTIGSFRFSIGPPVCGGGVDVAVITPAAFDWAQCKEWSIK